MTLAVCTVGSKNDVWQSDVEDYYGEIFVKCKIRREMRCESFLLLSVS